MKTTNTLIEWSPLVDMDKMGRGLLSLLSNTPAAFDWGKSPRGEWAPEVDVVEDEKEYRLIADLPEVQKEDLHVSYEDGSVEFRGERAQRAETGNLTYLRSERAYGKFRRSFQLPEDAIGEKTRAEFRDGSLLIHIPKAAGTTGSRKEIPIGS